MQKYGTHISLVILLGLAALVVVQGVRERAAEQALVGGEAEAFRLPTLDGRDQVGPQDYLGQVVLIDFWALYCEPCRENMPELQRLHDTYLGRGFTLLSVNVDPLQPGVDRPRLVGEYLRRHGYTFPVLLDYGPASEAYGVTSIPHMVLIDRVGQVRHVFLRSASFRDLRELVDGLLSEPG